jgi:hypothetical protein
MKTLLESIGLMYIDHVIASIIVLTAFVMMFIKTCALIEMYKFILGNIVLIFLTYIYTMLGEPNLLLLSEMITMIILICYIYFIHPMIFEEKEEEDEKQENKNLIFLYLIGAIIFITGTVIGIILVS